MDEKPPNVYPSSPRIPEPVAIDPIFTQAATTVKNRMYLLRLELELHAFMESPPKKIEFPGLNSYQRLLLHRLAGRFNLDHVVDNSRSAVVLYKTPNSQLYFYFYLDQQGNLPNCWSWMLHKRQSMHQSRSCRKGQLRNLLYLFKTRAAHILNPFRNGRRCTYRSVLKYSKAKLNSRSRLRHQFSLKPTLRNTTIIRIHLITNSMATCRNIQESI